MIECDVLVIGGGMAGCFAAVKAREAGAERAAGGQGLREPSGETPYAGDTAVFDPEWGHDLGRWLEQVNVVGEYMNNRHWNELVFRDSRERFADLRSWGVRFLEKDGESGPAAPSATRTSTCPTSDKFPPIVSEVVHWLPSSHRPDAQAPHPQRGEAQGQVHGHRAAQAGRPGGRRHRLLHRGQRAAGDQGQGRGDVRGRRRVPADRLPDARD